MKPAWITIALIATLTLTAAAATAVHDDAEQLLSTGEESAEEEFGEQGNASASGPNASEEAGSHANGSAVDAANPPSTASSSPHASDGSQPAAIEAPAEAAGWLAEHAWMLAGGLALVGLGHRMRTRREPPDTETEPAGPPTQAVEKPGPDGALLMGKQALDDGDPETAEAWFNTALDLDGELAIAHLCKGLCRIEQDRPDQAREPLERAIELDPSQGTARYHLARAQALVGQAAEAANTVAPLVQVDPSIVEDALEDPAFEALADDPRWLAALGRLEA